MPEKYEHKDKQLTSEVAAELIFKTYKGKDPFDLQTIWMAVYNQHLKSGGLPPRGVVKGSESEDIEKVVRFVCKRGLSILSTHGCLTQTGHHYKIHEDRKKDSLPNYPIELGKGKEEVYLYYYERYREFAELKRPPVWKKNRNYIWECCIGESHLQDADTRVKQQSNKLPEKPTHALTMRTDNSARLERIIHDILKERGKWIREAGGREWFMTSPKQVVEIYSFVKTGFQWRWSIDKESSDKQKNVNKKEKSTITSQNEFPYTPEDLRRMREKADLKQTDVAEALGMKKSSSSAIGDWEKGRLKVPAKHQEGLIRLYKMPRSMSKQPSNANESHLRFWTGLREYMTEKNSPLTFPVLRASRYIVFSIKRSDFSVDAHLKPTDNEISIRLCLDGNNAEAYFRLLIQQKQEIHNAFGEPLEWNDLPGRNRNRICLTKVDTDPLDENDWKHQYEWFRANLERFDQVFRPRIRSLDAADWIPEEDGDRS